MQATADAALRAATYDLRTERMLNAPVVSLLIRLALPNVAIMLVQASIGLIETWWVAELGTDALAGICRAYASSDDEARCKRAAGELA